MARYVLKRLLMMVVVVLGISFIVRPTGTGC